MSNGLIKRIDSLGRIVIPKDVRKRLSIKNNDGLEITIVDKGITLNKVNHYRNYEEVVKKYIDIFEKAINIKLLVTDREKVLYNSTDIVNIDLKKLINVSIYDLNEEKNKHDFDVDIRQIIIDSNCEGLVLITGCECNAIIGKLFNACLTWELDITC